MDKAEKLNELKSAFNIKTNAEFARLLGISPQNLSNWYSRNTFDENLILRKFTDVNERWLLYGEGEMLKAGSTQVAQGDNNTQVAGNGNHVNATSTLDKAIDEIAEQRKLVAKSQEQIDRLLSIIDRMQKNE